ncbi:hypothetical protein, partial [Pseudomonas poae]|uniref:hypothetical protein n=1 Tax=Pseudomonas poae TaxID=200451 RepID=UPI001D0C18B9
QLSFQIFLNCTLSNLEVAGFFHSIINNKQATISDVVMIYPIALIQLEAYGILSIRLAIPSMQRSELKQRNLSSLNLTWVYIFAVILTIMASAPATKAAAAHFISSWRVPE